MLNITVKTANEAYADDPRHEIKRILEELARRIDSDCYIFEGSYGSIKDINGNTVGEWTYDPEDED